MTHKKMQQWMSAQIDGRLAPEKEKRLQQHLKACAACRKLYHTFLHLHQHSEAPEVRVSPYLSRRVLARAEAGLNSVWNRFDFLAKRSVQTAFGILLIVMTLLNLPFIQEDEVDKSRVAGYPLISESSVSIVESNEDALEFLLTGEF